MFAKWRTCYGVTVISKCLHIILKVWVKVFVMFVGHKLTFLSLAMAFGGFSNIWWVQYGPHNTMAKLSNIMKKKSVLTFHNKQVLAFHTLSVSQSVCYVCWIWINILLFSHGILWTHMVKILKYLASSTWPTRKSMAKILEYLMCSGWLSWGSRSHWPIMTPSVNISSYNTP